jgi:ethanolamine permease
MAEDTLIPKFFAAKHPKYGTPYSAILRMLPIAIAFGFTGLFDQVVTFSNLRA